MREAKTGSFKVETYALHRATQGFCDIHDLTQDGRNLIKESGIENGTATFFVSGSTAGITTVEYEPGLIQDIKSFFERLIPQNARYHHEEAWHDGNGFSHVRASLLKPSLVIPVVQGEMTLGTWQQIILVDFDNRPRTRDITVQVMGI